MEADGEQSDEDGSEKGEVRKKGKGMVDKGKQNKGTVREEDTDVDDEYDPHLDDDMINKPTFI